MYKLVSTYLKPKDANSSYSNFNISLMKVGYIQDNFLDGYIELSNPALDDNVFMTIQQFREIKLPYRLDQTFEYWLRYIGNKTILGLTESRPNYSSAVVKARNAIQADYKISYVNRNYEPDTALPIGGLNDLYLRKPYVDTATIQNRLLATVNGYLHPTTPYYDGVAIVGGGSLVKTIGEINVGILSFASIGDVHVRAITEDNLFNYSAGIPLSDKCVVNVNMPLKNKSVIVVIGGYPLLDSDLVSVASDELGILNINTKKFDIFTHIIRQIGEINLEPLGISNEMLFGSLQPMSKKAILSDLITKKYLTLPQSFVVIVDTPDLTYERIPAVRSGLPDVHISLTEPILPLMDSYGRLVEYWISPENTAYSIITAHNYYNNFNYETIESYAADKVNQVMPVNGFQEHSMDFIRFTSVKLIS